MQFRDVAGQMGIKARLIKSVNDQRISHAQMFFGPPGSGKLPLVLAYSSFINCQNRSEEDSCGVCPSCLKIKKLVHPDLHFVFPVVKPKKSTASAVSDYYIEQWREAVSGNPYITENQWYEAMNAENKQGLISRKESSEVLRKLSKKSYEAEYKILVMWLAEKMNAPAASALLKLIEEPPAKTVFLLVAENTDQILPTILSRTQMIRVPPPDPELIKQKLLETYPDKKELVEDAVRRANRNYSEAVSLIESNETDAENFEEFVFLMRKCYGRDIVEIQSWTERISGWGRERLKHFLAYALRLIRENFILNLKQDQITFLSKKEKEFSEKFSKFIHQGNVFEMAFEFEKAIDHIEANGYARLVLLDLAIKNIMLLKQPAISSQ